MMYYYGRILNFTFKIPYFSLLLQVDDKSFDKNEAQFVWGKYLDFWDDFLECGEVLGKFLRANLK